MEKRSSHESELQKSFLFLIILTVHVAFGETSSGQCLLSSCEVMALVPRTTLSRIS